MAEITAAMVKALREETGQGMMDCKKALQEAGGDVEAAQDILRKKGLATLDKKASRATKEGLVAIKIAEGGTSAAMVEVQCETDFCSRNDVFKAMVAGVVAKALAGRDGPVEADDDINSAIVGAVSKIGENMSYARGIRITAPRVGTYVHHNNKVGVILGVDGEISDETLYDLCMHIAFSDPMGISRDDVPAELVEKETRFAREEAAESGKPPEIVEKMIVGKVNKFLAANALLDQPFVKDDKQKVKQVLGEAKITAFARYAVGG